jgi:hypothetical protein
VASAQGTTTIDFGAFPGSTDASVAVTGQAAIVGTSQVEAYLYPLATADHSADEHVVEMIDVMADASTIIAGTGFTIRAKVRDNPGTGQNYDEKKPQTFNRKDGLRLYGVYSVAWVWSD